MTHYFADQQWEDDLAAIEEYRRDEIDRLFTGVSADDLAPPHASACVREHTYLGPDLERHVAESQYESWRLHGNIDTFALRDAHNAAQRRESASQRV